MDEIALKPEHVETIFSLRDEFAGFLMNYKFAIDAMTTKLSILQEEFKHLHHYNPIEHVQSRLKSPQSILAKMKRRECDPSLDAVAKNITDIAGIRVTCSFIEDTYRILDTLSRQSDLQLVTVKDYIKNPKANGYRSLHAIMRIPVHLSDGPVKVTVELQIRTIAMDFWAALEHKIHYKYDGHVPERLATELQEASAAAAELDSKMERLHKEMQTLRAEDSATDTEEEIVNQLGILRGLAGA